MCKVFLLLSTAAVHYVIISLKNRVIQYTYVRAYTTLYGHTFWTLFDKGLVFCLRDCKTSRARDTFSTEYCEFAFFSHFINDSTDELAQQFVITNLCTATGPLSSLICNTSCYILYKYCKRCGYSLYMK
jgi:hypothetical protein